MRRSAGTSTPDRALAVGAFRYHFIGGKGGVGKTTCAASLAVHAARAGHRTLVVSTDPAPSLADVLRQPLGSRPRPIRGAPGLYAMELDARTAFAGWLSSRRSTLALVAERGTLLDRGDAERLLTLSLPGIDELAGLLQVVEVGEHGRFDRIIVDAAPTGHLLRMFAMPAMLQRLAVLFDRMQAKHRVMVAALRGGWRGDAADTLILELERQAGEIAALVRDRDRTLVSWVTLPEAMSIEESGDALAQLREQGIPAGLILVNRLIPRPPTACSWCEARRRVEARAVAALRKRVDARPVPIVAITAAAQEPRGIPALSRLRRIGLTSRSRPLPRPSAQPRRTFARLDLPAAAAAAPLVTSATRLMLFGGKGGVGKTTCAAAAALDAAARLPSRRVLLLSTDPAHSLADVLGQRCADRPAPVRHGPRNLAVRELDAARAFADVRAHVAAGVDAMFRRTSAGGALEATYDRQVMRGLLDLAPPGIDELAAIVEILDYVGLEELPPETGRYDVVVVDTAPTGHTLRLLEMPETLHEWTKALMAILLKYQSAVGLGDFASRLLRLSRGLRGLATLLRDPSQAVFATVTRPAAVPRAETVRLLDGLAASRIPTPLVIVNAAGAGTCRRCTVERAVHNEEVSSLRRDLRRAGRPPRRLLVAPAELPPPRGAPGLRAWLQGWRDVDGAGAASPRRPRRVR